MDTVADKLNFLLHKQKKTQIWLSEKTGIPQPTISNWCRGRCLPKAEHLNTVCSALTISETWLLYGSLEELDTYGYTHATMENQEQKEASLTNTSHHINALLTDDEFSLIQKYRCLSSPHKDRVEGYLAALENIQIQ